MRTPWWRKATGHWYLEVHGKQIRISTEPDWDGEKRKGPPPAVENEWHRLMREGRPEDMQVGDLFAAFIASLPEDSENRQTTRRQLATFERFVGREMKVSKLKPLKLTEYLATKPHWKPSSVRTLVNRVHAAINWGVRQGLLSKNPISSTPGYKREGRNERRRGIISEENRKMAEESSSPGFRAVLVALRESGARPTEICRARIEKVWLDLGYMLVPNKTAHLTGEAERKIYLSPVMKELIVEMAGDRKEGYIFTNRNGAPWTLHALKKRWETMRERTGIKGTLRTYRRTFISSAINHSNVNPAIVAHLAGHSVEVMMKHYFEADPEAMILAVRKITGPQSGSLPKADPGPDDR